MSPHSPSLTCTDRVTLLFDGDPAGQECTQDVLARLACKRFVKAVGLEDRQQPDSLSADELRKILG